MAPIYSETLLQYGCGGDSKPMLPVSDSI